MVRVVGVDHAPTTVPVFFTEAYPGPEPPVSVPVPKQLGSASDRGLETPPTVSDHAALTIVVANYWSFSICAWSVHYPSLCLIPSRKQPRN